MCNQLVYKNMHLHGNPGSNYDIFYSLLSRVGSNWQGHIWKISTTVTFGLMEARVMRVPIAFSNATVSTCDNGIWMDVLFHHTFFLLKFSWTRTAGTLGRCATAFASKPVVSAWSRTTSFYLCGSRTSGSETWANVDRCGRPITWPARSPDLTPQNYFLRGHMKRMVYEAPVGLWLGYGCGRILDYKI